MRIVLCKGQIFGPISGSDETLVTYAVNLQKAGHSVSVLLMYLYSEDDQYYRRLRAAGVPVAWLASAFAQTSLGTGRKVAGKLLKIFPSSKQLIRKRAQRVVTRMATGHYQQCRDFLEHQKPDLMHIITPDPFAMVMIRAGHDAGLPLIYQELGLPYHPPDFKTYYHEFASVLPLCNEVAALSPMLADYCRQTLPSSNTFSVLPIMSDGCETAPPENPQRNGSVNFGFAARMEELKGPMVLMEAFGEVSRHIGEVKLKIAGDGSQRGLVASRAHSLNLSDRYDYNGVYASPSDRNEFMRELDVFVMPSFTEGTPNSIIEAMANGRPIIASAVGGIPDMIDSESGILVPAGDTAALSDAMMQLAKNPQRRKKMGSAAYKRYRALFSPEAVVPLLIETYKRISVRNPVTKLNGHSGKSHPWSVRV